MSRPVGPGRPPVENRFRKGQSGNPKGRPRNAKPRQASAFDIVIDRTLTVTQGGTQREVTVEEALQHRTYQEAVAGNRAARREILKMIARRERHLAARQARTPRQPVETRFETDPRNADEAMLVLGIADHKPPRQGSDDEGLQLLLEPWAVQAALSRRRGGARLSDRDSDEIKRCTRDAGSLRWPRKTGE